jgi:hypothetical protein
MLTTSVCGLSRFRNISAISYQLSAFSYSLASRPAEADSWGLLLYSSHAQPLISPARGKLGVLLVGMGAVSDDHRRVLAIRKGFAKPIGSLTQMARCGSTHRRPLAEDQRRRADLVARRSRVRGLGHL